MNLKRSASGRYSMRLVKRGMAVGVVVKLTVGKFEKVCDYLTDLKAFWAGRWRGMTFFPVSKERKRLRPIGERMEARLAVYMRLRQRFLFEHQMCEMCEKRESMDVHHTRGRAGPLLTARQWWLAVCRRCHDSVREEPLKWENETRCGIPVLGTPWNHAAEGGRKEFL